jgi:hypothetical protein
VCSEWTIHFQLGDSVTNGGAGSCIFMPRGIPHAWKNNGAEAGRALFIYTPAEAGKLFEEFARLQRSFSLDDPAMEHPSPHWLGNRWASAVLGQSAADE